PGNVRELQNVVRNIVVLNDGELVSPDILPPPLNGGRTLAPEPAVGIADPQSESVVVRRQVRPLWQVEKEAIEQAI
ncbi:sigma-54-dependent Fis family transcriptional regulator, partial [Aeromonas caviae]|nr:sigma-54-dependent Fis family transcriptional regulator [Aeromonas caviae]